MGEECKGTWKSEVEPTRDVGARLEGQKPALRVVREEAIVKEKVVDCSARRASWSRRSE